MTDSITKLVSISSLPIGRIPICDEAHQFDRFGELGRELREILTCKNGFYAFESALHVLPSGEAQNAMTAEKWNSMDLWRYEYKDMADGLLFFAEDAFGNQFGLRESEIVLFDAETGTTEVMARTFQDWAASLLRSFNELSSMAALALILDSWPPSTD